MPACAVQGPYLPGYTATPDEPQISYGLQRLDHAVGNVHKLVEALEHIMGFTGWFGVPKHTTALCYSCVTISSAHPTALEWKPPAAACLLSSPTQHRSCKTPAWLLLLCIQCAVVSHALDRHARGRASFACMVMLLLPGSFFFGQV